MKALSSVFTRVLPRVRATGNLDSFTYIFFFSCTKIYNNSEFISTTFIYNELLAVKVSKANLSEISCQRNSVAWKVFSSTRLNVAENSSRVPLFERLFKIKFFNY